MCELEYQLNKTAHIFHIDKCNFKLQLPLSGKVISRILIALFQFTQEYKKGRMRISSAHEAIAKDASYEIGNFSALAVHIRMRKIGSFSLYSKMTLPKLPQILYVCKTKFAVTGFAIL